MGYSVSHRSDGKVERPSFRTFALVGSVGQVCRTDGEASVLLFGSAIRGGFLSGSLLDSHLRYCNWGESTDTGRYE